MRPNVYLQIIATVIAVELLLLIVKPSSCAPSFQHHREAPVATWARYGMPNILTTQQQPPMDVKIVGIELPSLRNNRNAVPVLTYNPTHFENGKIRDLPLQVQLQGNKQ